MRKLIINEADNTKFMTIKSEIHSLRKDVFQDLLYGLDAVLREKKEDDLTFEEKLDLIKRFDTLQKIIKEDL